MVGEQPSATSSVPRGLGPSSYTAQRLQHASPQHLHDTTQRRFIGPVPDNWLAKHRKAWYARRPRLATYSSKTAAFTAADDPAQLGRLAGISDLSGQDPKRYQPSFPQPTDADEQAGNEIDEGQDDSTNGLNADSARAEGHETSSQVPSQHLAVQSNEAGKSARLNARPNGLKPTKSGGDSFVTAPETPASGAGLSKNLSNAGASETNPAAPPDLKLTTSNISSGGRSLQPPSSTAAAGSSAESTTSLLPRKAPGASKDVDHSDDAASPPQEVQVSEMGHDVELRPVAEDAIGDNEGAEAESPPSASEQELHMETSPQEQKPTVKPLRQVAPVATGLVRFNLPADGGNDDEAQPSKSKVSEIRSLNPLRSRGQDRAEPGQLLKAERMLVRVDWTRHDLPNDFNENDSLKYDSYMLDKWREYIVACRCSATDDSQVLLQMTKTRVITVVDRGRHTKRKVAHTIDLDHHLVRINMFSSLDKTIALWRPEKKGTRIFLLCPRSAASSVEWYTFLRAALGSRRLTSLTVHVPAFEISLQLDHPFDHSLGSQGHDNQKEDTEATHDSLIKQTMQHPNGPAAQYIITWALTILEKSSAADVLRTWAQEGERFGLAWKRYDRLEWVHGANEERMYGSMAMAHTHDLELRIKTHYPTQLHVSTKAKKSVEEPAPVEGFLVRLTSQRGRGSRFGKMFFKKLYFTSYNQYLCFCAPSKAMPPKPPQLLGATASKLPSTTELQASVPLIYDVDPYPLKQGQVDWLDDRDVTRLKQHDQAAYDESERAIKSLLDAEGYINLQDVQTCRRAKAGSPAPPSAREAVRRPTFFEHEGQDSDSGTETAADADTDLARTFELVMQNGLVVRLQAYNAEARQEWVHRLRDLCKYWQGRLARDVDLQKDVKQHNLDRLEIDESMESYLGQYASKWEINRAEASPELYNICGVSCCRPITMAGTVYMKPRLHATFQRRDLILCHGKLLIFQSTLRRWDGHEVPHILHDRHEVIDLQNVYVYSGLAAENDLLYRDQTFDSQHPGHHALPRVYLEDNWMSCDEDTATCFVIWRGQRKTLFRSAQDSGNSKTQGRKLRYAPSLGVTGRSEVFKARSRTERDRWVMSLSTEIERLQQGADIRVVPEK